MKGIW